MTGMNTEVVGDYMYCTLETLKSICKGENKSIWLKDINEKNNYNSFEIESIVVDKQGDIILNFNPEYLNK